MGRLKKSAEQRRDHVIKLSLSDDELAQVQAKARGEPLARYCRNQILNRPSPPSPPPVPPIHHDKWVELGRLGGNLNQIARHLNSGEYGQVETIQRLIQATRAEIHQLRQEIDPR